MRNYSLSGLMVIGNVEPELPRFNFDGLEARFCIADVFKVMHRHTHADAGI